MDMYYKELNYDTYDEYLNGNEWKEIRDIFYLSGVKYRCTICFARKKLLVHKRSYYYLTPKFFRIIARTNKKLLTKILSYKCSRCNSLCHFYDKQKKKPVELDYLFLWEREKKIYWRVDMVVVRLFRTTESALKWIYYSYKTWGRESKRKNLPYY